MKTIILSGGGSGGHVTPALSVFKEIRFRQYKNEIIETVYIGREHGIERSIFERQVDVYFPIVAEKWRRYFSFKNLLTFFVVVRAFFQSLKHLYPYRKKAILFHTGGYVGLPPALAAFVLRIPVYVHEQTSRAGLANRISVLFARKVFVSFENSLKYFPKRKTLWVGYPISKFFYSSSKTQRSIEENGESYLGKVRTKKPLLLVTGGGNGSAFINELVMNSLDELTKKYFVLHQVGRSHLDKFMMHTSDSYLSVGLVSPIEWVFLLRRAAVIVARSGAGTVSECIYLNKKTLFIPLEIAQRKEQYHNALEAKRYIQCLIVSEKEAQKKPLPQFINELYSTDAQTTAYSSTYGSSRRTPTSKYDDASQKSSHKGSAAAKTFTRDDFGIKLTSAATKIVRMLLAELDGEAPAETDPSDTREFHRSSQGRRRPDSRGSSARSSARSSSRSSGRNTSQRDSARPTRQFSKRTSEHRTSSSPQRSSQRSSQYSSHPSSGSPPHKSEQSSSHYNSSRQSQSNRAPSLTESVKYVDNPFRKTPRPSRKKVASTSQSVSSPNRV